MLLMLPPATATVTGDSLSSTESTFRQLDDVFLQTQTRIWLGEVLHMRFDEQLDIGDLLSDGELLCEVSKILWNMLLVKFMELRHVKTHTLISNDSRKSSGRYMPYSNVDSFLKVCKVFGLDGIDLFSPSDVVEKRDTRKVCICIRSLSKKARSKQLNVPDFDIVTYTIAMPTDIVGCIRKSLELSRGRIMGPFHSSCKDKKTSLWQKSSVAAYEQMNESYPEDSDEAKRSSTGPRYFMSYSDNSHVDALELDLKDSAGVHSTVNDFKLSEEVDKTEDFQYYSEHLPESVESICFRYFSKLNSISSHGYESQMMLCHEVPYLNGEIHGHESSALDLIDATRSEGNDASGHWNFPADRVEVSRVSQQLALSDPTAFHTDTNHPVPLDEDLGSSLCMDNESYGSNSTPGTSKFTGLSSYPDNSNDVEVSSKISMSSLLSGRVLQFDFDAKHDEDDPYYEAESMEHGIAEFHKVRDMVKPERPLHCPILDTEESLNGLELENSDLSVESLLPYWRERSLCSSMHQSIESVDNQVGPNQRDSIDALWVKNTNLIVAANDLELEGKELADRHFLVDCGNNVVDRTGRESNDSCNCSAVEGRGHSSFQLQCTTSQDDGKEDGTHSPKTGILANRCESSSQKHPCSIDKGSDNMYRACHKASTDDSSTELQPSHGKHTKKDEKKDTIIDNLREERSEAYHSKRDVEKQKKPTLMVPLLKTVAKGTALIGVMFLLHLRIRNDRERKDEGGEKRSRGKKDDGGEKSSKEEKDEGHREQSIPVQISNREGKKGSSEVYPAEKLKLGD